MPTARLSLSLPISTGRLVVLDADLAGATMSKFFAAAHPERFFDCGIAEANMTDTRGRAFDLRL